MGSVGVHVGLSSCKGCDLNAMLHDLSPPSSRLGKASGLWLGDLGCIGDVGESLSVRWGALSSCRAGVHPLLKRSISSRKLLRAAVRRGRTVRASLQESVFPVPQEDLRGENGAAAAVLEGSTRGRAAALLGDDDSKQPGKKPRKETILERTRRLEELIERVIFNCRFFAIMAVFGSLAGSLLCFFKGSLFIVESFREYFCCQFSGVRTGKVILLLVEAVDVYLMGTVMLIFGMGLYELFISSLEIAGEACEGRSAMCGSNLFGLFRLRERPKWLEIRSLDELKTKLGHVIVMILLVGMFEKSKKVPVNSGLDLLCFAASILLASGCLFLLSKLSKEGTH